jgi:hypothetical protein
MLGDKMDVDSNHIHPCLLVIVDALAELGQLVLEEKENAAPPLRKAAGTGEEVGEDAPIIESDADLV